MRALILAAAVLIVGPANAQGLNKCLNAAGRAEYTDKPCPTHTDRAAMTGGTVSDVQALPKSEINKAMSAARREQSQAPAGPVVIGGGVRRAPTAQEIKNMETSASSVTISAKERQFLQDEVRRAKQAQRDGAGYSEQERKALDFARSSQTRVDPADREKARREAEAIHLRSGSQAVRDDVAATKRAEEERAAAHRGAAAAAPRTLTNCDGAGCWDTSGARYTRAAGGNFTRNDGKFCTPSGGGMLNCN